jgi:hypothetical protein
VLENGSLFFPLKTYLREILSEQSPSTAASNSDLFCLCDYSLPEKKFLQVGADLLQFFLNDFISTIKDSLDPASFQPNFVILIPPVVHWITT